ncbi:MAG: glutathione S-transferase family protein [Phenylobacterium sp.]|uniref:glutathione S-transferase family protein n=1 Tax=Phenylobacterium sp. TaxID=1871053 RepID=UPI00391AAF8F
MLRILGRTRSINVRKALWAAVEADAPFVHEDRWGWPDASLSSPDFLRLNPNGLVPVIVDADVVLWESNTICRYLAAKAGRQDLLPADPAARARVEMWMDWQATELNGAWRYAFPALARGEPKTPDPVRLAESVAAWNRAMAILNSRLAETGAYVAGDSFTVADVGTGLSAHRWRMTPMAHADLPLVHVYLERLADRPGFARYATEEWP